MRAAARTIARRTIIAGAGVSLLLVTAAYAQFGRGGFFGFIHEQEGKNLRTYLLKGGFPWADDFWGTYEWDHWVRELRHALPADQYPIFDVAFGPKGYALGINAFLYALSH